jgi:hypothetical protein
MTRSQVSSLFVALALVAAALACGFSATTARFTDAFLTRDPATEANTEVFAPEDTFYVLVDLANAPDGTTVKAVWVAVDADGVDFDTVIDEAELTTGDGRLTFDLANDQLWPEGNYKVDLYINDNLERTLECSVEA